MWNLGLFRCEAAGFLEVEGILFRRELGFSGCGVWRLLSEYARAFYFVMNYVALGFFNR